MAIVCEYDKISLGLKAQIHLLTQSCDLICRYGKPGERTSEIMSRPISLVRSSGFPAVNDLIARLSQTVDRGLIVRLMLKLNYANVFGVIGYLLVKTVCRKGRFCSLLHCSLVVYVLETMRSGGGGR